MDWATRIGPKPLAVLLFHIRRAKLPSLDSHNLAGSGHLRHSCFDDGNGERSDNLQECVMVTKDRIHFIYCLFTCYIPFVAL